MSSKRAAIEAWEALFRAQVAVLRDINREFPSDVLSITEYDVLFNLTRMPGRSARLRDLNRQLLLSQPSLSRLVDRLLARGLVSKCGAPDDGRGTVVSLTDAGFALFRSVAVRHAEAIHRRVGGALTDEELGELARLSDLVRLGLGGAGGRGDRGAGWHLADANGAELRGADVDGAGIDADVDADGAGIDHDGAGDSTP